MRPAGRCFGVWGDTAEKRGMQVRHGSQTPVRRPGVAPAQQMRHVGASCWSSIGVGEVGAGVGREHRVRSATLSAQQRTQPWPDQWCERWGVRYAGCSLASRVTAVCVRWGPQQAAGARDCREEPLKGLSQAIPNLAVTRLLAVIAPHRLSPSLCTQSWCRSGYRAPRQRVAQGDIDVNVNSWAAGLAGAWRKHLTCGGGGVRRRCSSLAGLAQGSRPNSTQSWQRCARQCTGELRESPVRCGTRAVSAGGRRRDRLRGGGARSLPQPTYHGI